MPQLKKQLLKKQQRFGPDMSHPQEPAAGIAVASGDPVTVSTEHGSITLPLTVTEMADGVVWLPTNSPGCAVHAVLGVTSGALVTIGQEQQ